MTHLTSVIDHRLALRLLASVFLLFAIAPHASAQTAASQDVCVADPTGNDLFSVGELRTSILSQEAFQDLNGAEWVLADGRRLPGPTALSPHLSKGSGSEGLTIPDVRGRFLRMANNTACAHARPDAVQYAECLTRHDPGGDRLTGDFQPDSFTEHAHGYIDQFLAWPNHPSSGMWAPSAPHWPIPHFDVLREHSGTSAPAGDAETRPKNIAVNFFIKICNCRTPTCR